MLLVLEVKELRQFINLLSPFYVRVSLKSLVLLRTLVVIMLLIPTQKKTIS